MIRKGDTVLENSQIVGEGLGLTTIEKRLSIGGGKNPLGESPEDSEEKVWGLV